MSGTVIIGAGHAGVELADALRRKGDTQPITMLGAESALPYQRPPLSKDYLTHDHPAPLPLRGPEFYARHDVRLRPGVSAAAIDPTEHEVLCSNGDRLDYDNLVLATGSDNRRLTIPGSNGSGLYYLRTIEDAAALHRRLADVGTAVIIGAGFIGLEFAAAAANLGIAVTVLESGPRPLGRALSAQMTAHVLRSHRDNGIRFAFHTSVAAIERSNGEMTAALDADGRRFAADIVVVGIGARPRVELADDAGLDTADGIIVDEFLQTSAPGIWAIGDCVRFPCRYAGQIVRRESIQNAVDQARTLASTLTGSPTPFVDLPWFWSHQGQCKIQIAGDGGAVDETIVVGDVDRGKFSAFGLRDGALTAVESINQPSVHLAARKALSAVPHISRNDLEHCGFDLKAIVPAKVVS